MQGRLGWQISTIGDIAEIKYGKARPQEAGSIPLVGSGGIYGYTNQALVDYETIVLGRKGSAGSVYYIDKPCYPSDTTFYLKWKKDVSVPFIYYWILLKGFNQDNSVIPSLQREDIKNFPIAFPPLPEQRAIARVLRAVQEVMQALRRELELERERKAALMHHLFRYGTRGEPTKQTEIGEIPQSWEVATINDIKANSTGALVAGPFGSNIGKRFFVETGVPVIRGNNLTTGEKFFVDDKFVFITEEKAEELKYCEALSDDIIITAAGTLGQVGIIPATSRYPRYIISNKQIRLRVRKDIVNPLYVFYWLSSKKIREIIKINNSGSSIPVINLTVVKSLPIPIPVIEEQNKIVNVMEACGKIIAALEQELALYQELFRTLLEELMSGRLSVQPLLEQEPALDT